MQVFMKKTSCKGFSWKTENEMAGYIEIGLFVFLKYAVSFWDYVALVTDVWMSMEQHWNYTDKGKPK